MALKNRLAKLEQTANPPGPDVIHVYLRGDDGLLRRYDAGGNLVETLTQAEFENLPGRKIHIPREGENDNDEE